MRKSVKPPYRSSEAGEPGQSAEREMKADEVKEANADPENGGSGTHIFRNILVALDSSVHSKAALESAAHMAERFRSGLKGLFVHEPGWTHRSKLTRSLRIDHPSGEVKVMAEETVELEMQSQEREVETHFRQVTQKRGVPAEWRVEKGSVKERMQEVAGEVAGEVDLVTMGVSGVSHLKTRKLGSTAMAMIEECGKPVMLLQEGLDLSGDIMAVYDGTPDGLAVVEMGARVAKRHGGTFFVIHFGEEHERDLREKLDDLFADLKVLPRFYQIPERDYGSYLYLLNRMRSGLLILAKSSRMARREHLLRILDAAHCPVMLM